MLLNDYAIPAKILLKNFANDSQFVKLKTHEILSAVRYGEREGGNEGYSHSHTDPVTPETVEWVHCLDTSGKGGGREGEGE